MYSESWNVEKCTLLRNSPSRDSITSPSSSHLRTNGGSSSGENSRLQPKTSCSECATPAPGRASLAWASRNDTSAATNVPAAGDGRQPPLCSRSSIHTALPHALVEGRKSKTRRYSTTLKDSSSFQRRLSCAELLPHPGFDPWPCLRRTEPVGACFLTWEIACGPDLTYELLSGWEK